MPRKNPQRSVAYEANLARRIQRERNRLSLSYEALAERMGELGCPIQPASVYRIEKGTPPRRITVDELGVLAEIFNLTVADLMTPMELIDQRRAHELIDEITKCLAGYGAQASEAFNAFAALYELAYENGELGEYVAHRLDASARVPSQYTLDSRGVDADGEVVADLALLRAVKADHDHQLEIRKAAAMWAAYRTGHWTAKDQRRARTELARLETELEELKVEREDGSSGQHQEA